MAKRTGKKTANRSRSGGPRTWHTLNADHRVVILHGVDDFLRAGYVQQLREALEAAHGEVDRIRFDGAVAQAADVLDECRSLGLMSQHKLVVVENADQFLKASEEGAPRGKKGRGQTTRAIVERYCGSPEAGATLVLTSANKISGNLVTKVVPSVGVVADCSPMPDAEAAGWLVKRAGERVGMPIDRAAAARMVARLGTTLGRLNAELGKLADAARARGEEAISEALVREFVGMSREETAWSIQRPVLAGDVPGALATLEELLTVSREPGILIRFALTDLARKLHGAALGLAQGADRRSLMGTLRLWGGSDRAVFAIAERHGAGPVAQLLRECIEADVRAKSGIGDERRGIESLIVRFASLAR